MMFMLALFVVLATCVLSQHKAIVNFEGKDVHGSLLFTKTSDGVRVEGKVTGLKPGKHGFNVHEYGDMSEGCLSTGEHFNPYKKHHGAPDARERHAGDLGNIEADEDGIANISIIDKYLDFEGERNILGRSVVIHENEDDLGKRRGTKDSLLTGNSGGYAACAIIGHKFESSTKFIKRKRSIHSINFAQIKT